MNKTIVTIPATSANLGPGFDCLGLALSLYNQIIVTPADQLTITLEGEGADKIPTDPSNWAYRAFCYPFQQLELPIPIVHFHQINQIPVGSGLGSSAAARLGGLLAGNAFLPASLPPTAILEWAAALEGHPDNVAPALLGGLTLALINGGLFVHPLAVAEMEITVVLPAFALPTAQARAVLPTHLSRQDAVFNAGHLALLVEALRTGDIAQLRLAMQDRLHQPYRLPLIPGMMKAFAAVQALGAAVALSGAGPSLLVLADGKGAEISQTAMQAFAEAGLSARSWQLNIDRQGAIVQKG